MSFERRRPNEMTTVYLGRVLDEYLGLPDMARRAREGLFDDFFCPPEVDDGMNKQRLLNELLWHSEGMSRGSPQRKRIVEVIDAVKTGDFDGTIEESNRWAASKEGRELLKELYPNNPDDKEVT